MKSLALAALFAALVVPAMAAPSLLPRPVPPPQAELTVDLWPDRGDGAVYNIGDSYMLYFRPNEDCYVTIYEIDTDGNAVILFPQYPDDGFVFGGMTVRMPGYYDRGSLRAMGPRGIAYVHAVATRAPNLFNYYFHDNAYFLDAAPVVGDPFVAMNAINARLLPPESIEATATVTLFIGGHVWYPRYTCAGCHATAGFRYDPYDDVCPRYDVRTAVSYDYWWNHAYYPVRTRFVFAGPFWRFELRTSPWRRDRHARYIDCAHGYGNYHPIVFPRRAYVYHERHEPPNHVYRTYQRDYKPVTYTQTRERVTREYPSRPRTTGPGTPRDTRPGVTTPPARIAPATPESRSRERAQQPPRVSPPGLLTPATPDTRSRDRVEQPKNVTPPARTDTRQRDAAPKIAPQPRVEQPRGTTAQPRVEQPRSVTPQPRVEQPRSVTPQPRVEQPRSVTPQRRADQPRAATPQARKAPQRDAQPRAVKPQPKTDTRSREAQPKAKERAPEKSKSDSRDNEGGRRTR